MSPDTLFQAANSLALVGWFALVFSPLAPRALGALAGLAIPLVLSGVYTALLLAHWAPSAGGFDSLRSVEQLFQSRWLLLAGWTHYLAFDLLLGAWQVRTARREGMAHLTLLPCLLATFLFGPAGYLLFQLQRASLRVGAKHVTSEASPVDKRPASVFSLTRLAADSPRYTRLAVLIALAMLPLALALALDVRRFQDVPVWVKPLKFHAALVVYLITLAVFARFASPEFRQRPWWRWHEHAVVVAIVLELMWIGGAASMGVGSHFNHSSPLWSTAYSFMGAAAVLLTSACATLAWAIHRHPAGALSGAVRCGLVWGVGLTLPLTLITATTLSGMGGHWIGGTPSDASGVWLMGWSRDCGDLRVSHFLATHAMHAIPLAALACAKVFGRDALVPVRFVSLAYVVLVVSVFVQALMGRPFIAG